MLTCMMFFLVDNYKGIGYYVSQFIHLDFLVELNDLLLAFSYE
jgi:hypothetical protein